MIEILDPEDDNIESCRQMFLDSLATFALVPGVDQAKLQRLAANPPSDTGMMAIMIAQILEEALGTRSYNEEEHAEE